MMSSAVHRARLKLSDRPLVRIAPGHPTGLRGVEAALRRLRSRRRGKEGAPSLDSGDLQALSVELFAHDLRSPVIASRRAIVNLLDPARSKDGHLRDQEAAPVLEALERCLERIDHLTENILELASLPLGSEVKVEEFALEQLVTGVTFDCSDHQRVSFEVPRPLVVAANLTLLQRALLNLVENAIRHTSGPVHVTLREAAGGLTMLVDDHGPGVPEELRDMIFEPLARADPESTTGWGLGLALVRRVAEIHRGVVGVESAPTGGARFVLWVPEARSIARALHVAS